MKYLILITCFFMSFAASGQIKMMNAESGANKLTKLYDLNADQTSQTVAILETKLASLKELKSQRMDVKTLAEETEGIEKTYQKSFEAILNPDQKLAFQNHMRIAEKSKKSLQNNQPIKLEKVKPVR